MKSLTSQELPSSHINQPETQKFDYHYLDFCCLMAEVRLKPNPKESDIAWFSFDLQEHKTHNNAALVMDHF